MRCLLMLYIWLRSHFRCEKSVFLKAYLPHNWPIKKFCENEWSGPKTKGGWIAFLQTASDMEIIWLAPWMPYVPLLYRCGDKALGIVTLIIGGNQLYTSDYGKAVRGKTVYTVYCRVSTVGILI